MRNQSFTALRKNAMERIRKEGVLMTLWLHLRFRLTKIGIVINLFYYIKEVLPSDIPAPLTTLPEGFTFSTFGPEEIEAISRHPERKGYTTEQYVLDNFNKGDTCLGIKHRGQIAGFTWFSLQESRCKFYPSIMKADEAYLYDMYVFKAFRGRNLAPILRYKNYEILRDLGRDTFYSVTDCRNRAALRFKQKLNARIVFLGIHVNLFKKYCNRWVLRRY